MICNILQINSAFFFPTNIRHFQPNSNVCVLMFFSTIYFVPKKFYNTKTKAKER